VDGNDTNVEMVTPYLVSRFYRAPEIILGLVPTYAIDLWSLAVTVAELFLGKVLFQGMTNNDMLHVMMQHMGPISNRLIRQHVVQTKRFPLPAHFTQEAANYIFRQETVDPVSGQPVHKAVSLQGFSPSLQSKLLKAKSAKDSRTMVLQFSDLLQKCLTLDPTRRIAVKIALQHEFFKDKPQNNQEE
jgi:serine/threonine-protein kinase PRP4